MKISLLVIGRAGALFVDAIAEFERRAARYWSLDVLEIREERARKGSSDAQIRAAESNRLLEKVPAGSEIVALTRQGRSWSSDQLARHLEDAAVQGRAGVAFLIGGALGLSEEAIQKADRTLSISSMTLTHELARLIFTEQLYRAGTIVRGEPYHKARS
ncbi:MAG TPA: 23S rRNA (pseudouridine(1915)-N(3))-methyltransferase RlmH [Longimicrobiales bacterium]